MQDLPCPPFLKPRLRLFLSADIVGSTSLKQKWTAPGGFAAASEKGPDWFSAIQGFYFEAAQEFHNEWSEKNSKSEYSEELYGDEPVFWKSVGDEVLFVKVLGDHRQIATTFECWFGAVERMRAFLKRENSSLDVKCTAWVTGFPFRNREVVIGRYPDRNGKQIENYYQENGILLNKIYNEKQVNDLSVDYIGPSIDTGFRLTNFSSSRKMVISVDIAYLISMTNFDGEVKRIDLNYDGSHALKGVMGGALYPIFWINMSGKHSLAVKEDKLRSQSIVSREDVKEYCDSFYIEYEHYTFRPFIQGDVGQTMAKMPSWYAEYHASLVKNFNLVDNEYISQTVDPDNGAVVVDPDKFEELLEDITANEEIESNSPRSQFQVGDKVKHRKFGEGIVTEVVRHRVEVFFEIVGKKTVLSSFLDKN